MNIIDDNIGGKGIELDTTPGGNLKFTVRLGWFKSRTYHEEDIEAVKELSADTHRSLARGVGYAVAGGVLTGGLGLLAGAAIGGRQRKEASYLVQFRDAKHVALSTKKRAQLKRLDFLVQRTTVQEIAAAEATSRRSMSDA